MLNSHLLNSITKNQYKHVMSMICLPTQYVKYTTELVKVLKNFTTKVVIVSCPAEYDYMHVQVLASPEVHERVFSLVEEISF